MRISTATIASALLVLSLGAAAQAEDGRIYYKGGTILETEDHDVKINVQLQPRYTYVEPDSDTDDEEVSDFRLRRARLSLAGNLMDKTFSYKLQEAMESAGGNGDLRDAWIQWNGPVALRFGQYKVPFSRQENTSSSRLYFAERSDVSNFFAPARDNGVMAHGELAPGLHYYAGVYNGEGRNQRSDDTDHRWNAALDYTTETYGKRGAEGDLDMSEFGFTGGVSVIFEQDEEEGEDLGDVFLFNGDVGIRVAGFDVQSEFFFSDIDSDVVDEEPDFFGFYGQATYTMDVIGVGARYGYLDFDDFDGVEDSQEYSGVLNYFINGHELKAQLQISFFDENFVGGESITDFVTIAQLSGYF